MKQQLFGLRKAHVNKLLKKMKTDFSSKNNQLALELKKIISENKQLEREIEERTNEIPDHNGDLEVWKLGKERIDDVIHYLDEKKTIEMEEIRTSYSEEGNRISQQIEELDIEIQSVEKLFSDMLNQFTHQLENPDANLFSSELKDVTENEQKGLKNEPQIDRGLAEISSNKEVAASSELIEHGETNQTSFVEEEHSKVLWQNTNDSIGATAVSLEKHTPDHNESFWGDVEEWANTSFSSLQELQTPDSSELIHFDEVFDEKVIRKEDSPLQSVSTESESKSYVSKEKELPNVNLENHSDALLEQIDSIKTQYIIGKVAGEELFDLHGQVIIAKNSLITRDAVEKANQIGKLAELIVNMKLTGGGVD